MFAECSVYSFEVFKWKCICFGLLTVCSENRADKKASVQSHTLKRTLTLVFNLCWHQLKVNTFGYTYHLHCEWGKDFKPERWERSTLCNLSWYQMIQVPSRYTCHLLRRRKQASCSRLWKESCSAQMSLLLIISPPSTVKVHRSSGVADVTPFQR